MKLLQYIGCAALGAGFLATASIAGTGADVPRGHELTALATLQPGLWILRGLDAGSPSKAMCVADVRLLLQVAHGKTMCTRSVISDSPTATTVYYSCAGQGHGQTNMKVETPRLVQIDSQGVIGNEPFAVSYEVRRMGECQATTTLVHQR